MVIVARKKNGDVSSLEYVYILNYLNIVVFKNIKIKKYKNKNTRVTKFHAKSSPPSLPYTTGGKSEKKI